MWRVSHSSHPLRCWVNNEILIVELVIFTASHNHDSILATGRASTFWIWCATAGLVVSIREGMFVTAGVTGRSSWADIRLLNLARVQCCSIWSLSLYNRCCCGCLVWSSIQSSLGQALERGRVGCGVCGNVWIIYYERVDVVIRNNVCHYLLVLFRSCYRPPTLCLRRRVGLGIISRAWTTALFWNGALEDNLGAFIWIVLQTLAKHLSLTLLLRLVVKVEHLGGFCRLTLLYWMRLSNALSLQGLPIWIALMIISGRSLLLLPRW